jgi:diguanylate cyclase (GGDEF)-like protein
MDPANLNRRKFQRQPISLSALVHPKQGRSWLCTIRDFCQEGMLLTGSAGSKSLIATGAAPAAGDDIALHFSVATPQGQKHYRTKATIARITEAGNGIGVRFDQGMPEDAFSSLIEFAIASGMLSRSVVGNQSDASDGQAGERSGQGQDGSVVATQGREPAETAIPDELFRDRRISDEDAAEVRTRIRRVTQRALDRVCSQFFGIVDNELLVKARDAGTNAVQMMYFEGLEIIEKNRDQIRNDFIGDALKQIDHVSELEEVLERRRRQDTGNATRLEIVDTEQFEEWLAVAEIISKAENRYPDELLDLRAQLGLVAKPWTHKDVIPIGPAVLAWSFDDAVKGFEFRRVVKQDIYHCFENALIPVLGNLYAALSKLLEDSKVFPSVEELRESLQRTSVKRTPSGVRVEPEAYQDMDTAVREATMAADGISQATSRVDHNPFVVPPRSRSVYGAARNLLGLERQTRTLLGQPVDDIVASADTPIGETFGTEDILSALADIEHELGDAHLGDERLKPRLIELLQQRHGQGKRISEEDYDTLDVMENLVGSMRKDELLTEGIREWIQRLELTLNKLAARDPAFLREEAEQPHGAVQMLNQLARLGNSKDVRDGIDRDVGKRVDELLQKVVREFDENPKVFDEVVDELNPLVDKQTRAYRGNIERTIRASEGQQKLARARKSVVKEIEQRVDDRKVPELLLELLNPGWRNLMVHTHLRQGVDSPEWHDQLNMVDQLWGQLSGDIDPESEDYVDPDQLLKKVVAGLNSISFDPSKRTPLIMKLSSALVGDTTGQRTPARFTEIEPEAVEEALGLKGLLPETELEIQSEDEDVKKNFSRAVDRAKRIQIGEWLATSDTQGLPLILTVAFVGDEASSFVLVNRKGIKNRELQLKDMAEGLHAGRITLLEDYDLPLMERASQRMLENLHGQLTYQASHDDLTQLANRKEFERMVERAITDAKAHETQHALLYLDLDQFKIVNNTSGHTAGDECLKLIADTVTRTVSNRGGQIARLGGDEFGVLIEKVDTQEARDLAEDLLNAVRKERFKWDGREYTLSASMGLVFVDQTTESVDAAMQFADEACYTAKDAGRNRLQEYELGDATMMRRHGVMEWVTELDKALNEERLILNCQRIVPINRTGTSVAEDHYEILLTMRDELGETMPPTDFIIAAETYNRMTAIDRWVIESVLNWMSLNRDQLDHFGGFSINVSGHSINDETFPDFVLEQFSNTQAPTGKVCFEITETAAIANLENAVDFMNRMKIIGCQFSLDDFGTGLSSYSYLRNLPVDFVKIDGVFVKDIATNPGDYAVVRSINEIGHYMGKKTIAEYVENKDVLERLRDIGVDYAQGYEIEKPRPLDELRIGRGGSAEAGKSARGG